MNSMVFKLIMASLYICKLYMWPRLAAGTWRVVKSLLCLTGFSTFTTGEVQNQKFLFSLYKKCNETVAALKLCYTK